MDIKVKYQVIFRPNVIKPTEAGKYYPAIRHNGRSDVRYIVEELRKQSTISPMDIVAVIEGFLQLIPDLLAKGFIVDLGEFGSFRLKSETTGELDKEEVRATNIKKINVGFRPSREFRHKLSTIKFGQLEIEE